MITPTVTEIPRSFSAVGHDTFIDGARDAVPGVGGAVTHLPIAARPAANADARRETFPRAA
jgi:hypothetical protein